MSNFRLPPELLDYLFDLLHEEPETLKYCCLISKSWVPRIRKHLFATVEFRFASDLESWKKTFPDPANSPAYHTHTLIVGCPRLVVEADAEEGGWIRAFSRVTRLELDNGTHYISEEVSLAPFFNFSPALKSLRVCIVTFPFPQLFDLIRSSPYLEDLSLKGYEGFQSNDRGRHEPQTGVPSTSPPLTGTLDICITGWMGNTTCRLLELPNGLHFRKLKLWWLREEDLRWLMKLIVSCSRTLECLDIASHLPFNPGSPSINLSKATRLRDLVFRAEPWSVGWVTTALRTITPKHQDLRQISIHVPYHLTRPEVGVGVDQAVAEPINRQWSDLEMALLQFWESHSICPRIVCPKLGEQEKNTKPRTGRLLPRTRGRRMGDPI